MLSEYGITHVSTARARQPRAARGGPARGARRARPATCSTPAPARAFAVADHQVAHVYVNDPAQPRGVRALLEQLAGRRARARRRRQARARARPRARGDLVPSPSPTRGSPTTTGSTTRARPTSRARSTSTASRATTRPSCSSTRRSGCPKLRSAELAQKKLGFRYLMDVIPLDATLVRGSHGRPTATRSGRRSALHEAASRTCCRAIGCGPSMWPGTILAHLR